MVLRGPTGRPELTATYGGEQVRAFIPNPLPPEPAIDLAGMQQELEAAILALGRFDNASHFLPDPALFLAFYVRREALISSQIEGTQSSFSDVLLFEYQREGNTEDDEREVVNYVAALSSRAPPPARGQSPRLQPVDPRDARRPVGQRPRQREEPR